MGRYAAIDVGSNSILMWIAQTNEQGEWRSLLDKGDIVRLSEGLTATGELKPQAMDRAAKTLNDFVNVARDHGVDEIAAVGTECLRAAKNAKAFVERVWQECGLDIEVISGEEEARLSYLAVQHSIPLPAGRVVVFDVGGGSTEFVVGKGDQVQNRQSIKLGAAGLTEKYLVSDPVTNEEMARLSQTIEKQLSEFRFNGKAAGLVGIGGTVTTIAAVMHKLTVYDAQIVHGSVVPLAEVEGQIALYRSLPIKERKRIVGLQPKRADVILAGVCVVYGMMKRLMADSLMVSDQGLRHGVLYDRYAN
jgi:exopolyphosphatase/guanosine-5'-triphosphate,3'-diphosphate pyrophosphatase